MRHRSPCPGTFSDGAWYGSSTNLGAVAESGIGVFSYSPVLPDWVVREVKYSSDYTTRPLTQTGITRTLYAATRGEDLTKKYVKDLIHLAGEEAKNLQMA